MSLFFHYLSLPYLLEGIGFTLEVTCLGLIGGLIMGLSCGACSSAVSGCWLHSPAAIP